MRAPFPQNEHERLEVLHSCYLPVPAVVHGGGAVPLDRLRVLVAEDNALNQRLITHMLTRLGCRWALAVNGEAAVRLYSENQYDVVLMDCQMPELDGYEATKKIRDFESSHSLTHTPVLAVTAHAMTGDRALPSCRDGRPLGQAFESGASGTGARAICSFELPPLPLSEVTDG